MQRLTISLLVAVSCLTIAGCARGPADYALPAQFAMPSGSDPVTEVRLIKMNHPDAPFSIVSGVLDAGNGWGNKWTLERAHFQLIAGDLTNTDLYVRYALDPTTLRDRGPITVTIHVNGKAIDAFTESTPGEHEHRAPADALKSKNVEPIDLVLSVNPPWISPDGTRLGVFLDAIGFVPRR